MKTFYSGMAVLVLLFAAATCPVQGQVTVTAPDAGDRLALVIGNDKYSSGRLLNAGNDAVGMSEALAAAGFHVSLVRDADLHSLDSQLQSFVAKAGPGDTVFIYFAGHGFQIEGENYLVPVDFVAADQSAAKYKAYSLSRLLDGVAARHPRLTVAVIDACRDNPFSAARGGAPGLAAIAAGTGTYIAFATAPGRTASDNPEGRHGLFTQALLDAMQIPALNLDELFARVRVSVNKLSGGSQSPWTASSVTEESPVITRAMAPPLTQGFQTTPNLASNRGIGAPPPRGAEIPMPDADMTKRKRAVSQWPRSSIAQADGANALAELAEGNLAGAEAALNSASVTSTDSGSTLLRTRLLIAQNHPQEALALVNEAIEANPFDTEAVYLRSLTFALLGQYARALKDCNNALVVEPRDKYLLVSKANILYVTGHLSSGLQITSDILALDSSFAVAYVIRGNIERALGMDQEAAIAFARAAALQAHSE